MFGSNQVTYLDVIAAQLLWHVQNYNLFKSLFLSKSDKYLKAKWCIYLLVNIASDNGLLLGWHLAIIWNSAGILLIGAPGTNFNKISKIHKFIHFH